MSKDKKVNNDSKEINMGHSVVAKSVLKDKFWIVENKGERIGTLSFNDDRYIFASGVETCFLDNKKQLKKKLGVDIVWSESSKEEDNVLEAHTVHGYPCAVKSYNEMFDVKRKLPLFTKSNKSKSLYCAGFYIIKFEKGWVKSFCPKLITIERYPYKGPFKTEIEMRQELSRANR